MTVFGLKIVAIIMMTVDHFAFVFGNQGWGMISNNYSVFMRCAGRIVFPIFAFLIANGWKYSKNRIKYFSNLLLFAIISQLPFVLSFHPLNKTLIRTTETPHYLTNFLSIPVLVYALLTILLLLVYWYFILHKNFHTSLLWVGIAAFLPSISLKINHVWLLTNSLNVLYTMAIGMFAIYCYEFLFSKIKHNWWEYLVLFGTLSLTLSLYGVNSDYGIAGVVLILLFHIFNQWRMLQIISTCLFSLYISVDIKSALAICLAALMIYFYNNKKGPSLKYFFYIYYPAHLLLLGLINLAIKFNTVF